MLTKIGIKNFECFRELEVAPLRRVNLITGKNNTGKTALLEALSVLLAQPSPVQHGDLFTRFRSGNGNAQWLFYQNDSDLRVELRAMLSANEELGWWIQKQSLGVTGVTAVGSFAGSFCYRLGKKDVGLRSVSLPTRPSNPNQEAMDFNRVVLKRRKKELVKLLRPLEDRLVEVETLNLDPPHASQGPLLYAELQGLPEMIPVTHLGQGFMRLLDIFSEILANDAQVLLVDEIENGIHYSVLPIIWKGLFNAAKEANLQIFATTHSWECVLAADQAAREATSYDLSLIRLDRVEGEVKATVMDEKTLSQAREFDWELR